MGQAKAQKQRPHRDTANFDDAASTSSAMSLHSNIAPADADVDIDSAPPPYSDNESAPLITGAAPSSEPPADLDSKVEHWVSENWKGSSYTRLSPTLTTDPHALEKYIRWEAQQQPRAYIRVSGHHMETHKNRDNGSKTERVEDFEFKADVKDTFGHNPDGEWNYMQTASNFDKTYRGTLLKTRPKKRRTDHENAPSRPSLKEWCHLFCASSAPLKSFTLRHTVVNRNEKYITEQIIALIRQTHYRGVITVTYPLHHRTVTIISPHAMNRLRNNRFIWWACVLLQLWIITWPVLFFMTKRWEVVQARWEYKLQDPIYGNDGWRYYKDSEADWCRKWKNTIQRTALSRVKGGTEVQIPVDEDRDSERRRAEARQLQDGFVGGTLALVRGVSDIVREHNATSAAGWGYNT